MFKNRTYLPSGKRTPRAGGTCVAKNGALKLVSSRIELPDGRFGVRLGWRGCGSANSSVTDAAKNRTIADRFLILGFIWFPFTILLRKFRGEVFRKEKECVSEPSLRMSTATDERRHEAPSAIDIPRRGLRSWTAYTANKLRFPSNPFSS